MLQESVYRTLYDELTGILKHLHPTLNEALYHEVWLQMSVLNGERAIAKHGRELVISNLKLIIKEPCNISDMINRQRFLSVAAKELSTLEASKDVDWQP